MQKAWKEGAIDERASARANRLGLLFGGIGAGAVLMYLLDPDKGRGRRAKLQDQLSSKVTRLGGALGSKARDLRNRAQGLLHQTGLARGERRQAGSLQIERDYESMEQGT
jgi:hypothetical protein